MKSRLNLARILAVLPMLSGCIQDSRQDQVMVVFSSRRLTKSAVVDDSAIHHLDLFVTRSGTGAMECHVHGEGSGELAAELPGNVELSWLLVANGPEGMDPDAPSRMDDNSADALVMSGNGRGAFTEETSVGVRLSRLMSKVVLETVSPSEGFRRAWLKDVSGTCSYALTPESGAVRYNVSAPEDGLCPFMSGCMVADSLPCGLFCYPDPDGMTSLVVEFDAPYGTDSHEVPLPKMQCNTTYIIRELVISGRNEMDFSIVVAPWEENDSTYTLE